MCKKSNGSLLNKIMSISKQLQTSAMYREINLEKPVIEELQKEIKTDMEASPYGISRNTVIEIKCPISEKHIQIT